ncbi:MAG TPA: hypothetical protein VK395_06180 [Gemmataceae bacterium]|nr:hypothetical protein [Gemmataceae bacterium]
MDVSYTCDKLRTAVFSLSHGKRPLREKIGDAFYLSGMTGLGLRPDKFLPGDLLPKFNAIRNAFSRAKPVGKEGKAAATLRLMTDAEADSIAKMIRDLEQSALQMNGQ